jgi:hypothetical protein
VRAAWLLSACSFQVIYTMVVLDEVPIPRQSLRPNATSPTVAHLSLAPILLEEGGLLAREGKDLAAV